ncbi:phosphonate metabolism protein/1,5-bisphosphokinase (PRPP-forming) PhnN [Devosia sp.]|uniref:phosphonate metabolism protein/1,5-bisphosphokinase (PRPP-forming) PhnN n=1 Tax=Devosia sp. TaxID=1871048 RepID=UPI002AFEACE4|nr:phosphonate metabolism protein/1,5-bisphosphokinase (PRPP-forming) PhnN [Devosia sp.]
MAARPLGSLVLVVGPSGVGKDTLIAGARQALDGDKRFSFVRRLATPASGSGGDEHDEIEPALFAEVEAAGRLALCWEAHERRYGLPLGVDTDIALGRIVVASVSRHAVTLARARYPNAAVVLITAEISRRAERLLKRGRENSGQVTARLARESPPVPAGVDPVIIDNSGPLAIGITAFVMALRAIAAEE